MTSRGSGIGLVWLVAPLTAATFAGATEWTLHHDPVQPTAQHTTQAGAGQSSASELAAVQQDARLAARRLARVQASVLRLESSLRQRSVRADRLESTVRAARQGRRARLAAVTSGSASASLPALTPLSPVQVPTTVHTTTGAS